MVRRALEEKYGLEITRRSDAMPGRKGGITPRRRGAAAERVAARRVEWLKGRFVKVACKRVTS